MNAKNNRTNTDFQIAYFLAGSCHTPDGAYALLKSQEQLKALALASADASEYRIKSLRQWYGFLAFAGWVCPPLRNYALWKLKDLEASKEVARANYAGAVAELEFMRKCIDKIQPHRKLAHLPDTEAFEACQKEEWKLHLISEAQNHLIANGVIPAEHFKTMRMHPDFKTEIYPAIENMKKNGAVHLEPPEVPKLLNG